MAEQILITGASGYLGSQLVREVGDSCVGISRREPQHDIGPAEWRAVDLADGAATEALLDTIKPRAIVHCAAAQADASASDLVAVNEDASAQLARWAARHGARMIYVSSDMVHGGDAGPYADSASPSPINPYGRSKAEGERLVLAEHAGAVVVRTSLIYGLDAPDRGTAGLLDRLAAGQTLSLWQDVVRQPMEIVALTEAIATLVERVDVAGVVNVAGAEAVSRAGFALALLRYWMGGIDASDPRVSLISLGPHSTVPRDLRLTCERASRLGLRMPGVTDVVTSAKGS